MKIEKLSVTTAGIGYSKKDNIKSKENNISFTGINISKKFIPLPLVLASLGISTSTKAEAETISNDTTKIEMVSQNYNAPLRNTNNWNITENLLISDLPSNVKKFIEDNNINVDGNEEINSRELVDLCYVAKNKAYNDKQFNTQTANNIDNLSGAVLKTASELKPSKLETNLFDYYTEYISDAIEFLTKKNNMTLNKDEQITGMYNYLDSVKNTCNKNCEDMRIKCINLDEATYNMAKSLQKPEEQNSIKREDYNFSLDYWTNHIEPRNDTFIGEWEYKFADIVEFLNSNRAYIGKSCTNRMIETCKYRLQVIDEYKLVLSKCQQISAVMASINPEDLSPEQTKNYNALCDALTQFELVAEDAKAQTRDFIKCLRTQSENIGILYFKPGVPLSQTDPNSFGKMIEDLGNDTTNVIKRYDDMIDALAIFGNLKNLTATVEAGKTEELNMYNDLIQKIKYITEEKIDDNSSAAQDLESCNEILSTLLDLRAINNQGAYNLTINGLNGMVSALGYNEGEVSAVTTIEESASTNNKDNISSTGYVKVFEDGKVVIKPINGSNENNWKQTSISGIRM